MYSVSELSHFTNSCLDKNHHAREACTENRELPSGFHCSCIPVFITPWSRHHWWTSAHCFIFQKVLSTKLHKSMCQLHWELGEPPPFSPLTSPDHKLHHHPSHTRKARIYTQAAKTNTPLMHNAWQNNEDTKTTERDKLVYCWPQSPVFHVWHALSQGLWWCWQPQSEDCPAAHCTALLREPEPPRSVSVTANLTIKINTQK